MAKLPDIEDPTLRAVDLAMEAAQRSEPRGYLGASAIGDSCNRKLWMSFRWVKRSFIAAPGLRRINDGHRGELIVAQMLRAVPGISLSTEVAPGVQHSFEDLGGHFRGNCDGLITGLLQDPQTMHVWECKIVNEQKFKKLQKLRDTDQSTALKNWDPVYYAQAIMYMHYFKATRHYLTAGSPGVRDLTSVVTEYDKKEAEKLIERAKRIVFSSRPPLKISNDPAWHECKYCTFHSLCHEREMPQRKSCRTCLHSTALEDGKWKCELHQKELDLKDQEAGCDSHLFVPDLIPGEQVNAGPNWVEYKMEGGTVWIDTAK